MVQVQDAASPHAIPTVAVGFSPPDGLAPLAEHLGWSGPFLADEDRLLYRRLGLRRAPWWRIYSPGTLAFYARALARGHHIHPAVEDTRQLGGVAILHHGVVVTSWNPCSPDDRVDPNTLITAALRIQTVACHEHGTG